MPSNLPPELADNPLMAESGLPPFDRIQTEHVLPAVRFCVARAVAQLDELEKRFEPTWAGTMEPIEELERPFEYSWKPVGHLFSVKNSKELREAYETVEPEVIAYGLRVRQSEPLYRALVAIRDGAEWSRLTPCQQRIVEDRIKDARLAGIDLPPEQRARFNEIEQRLSKLANDFSNHCLDATKAWSLEVTSSEDAAGWPSTLRSLAAHSWNSAHTDATTPATPENGPWRITLEIPLYVPFQEHCRNPELREQAYRAFILKAASDPFDNQPFIPEILRLRQEKATLLGFANYAELSLVRKMAPSVDAIQQMFQQLREAAWTAAEGDLADLKTLRAERGEGTDIRHWDVGFYAERLREQRYAYTDEEVRPYFPLERVLDGLFSLCGRLFEISFARVSGVPVWHPDVRYYDVRDKQGTTIAGFYLDPFSRPADKRGGAWMNDCLGRRRVNGRLQIPVAHLVCNQTPPAGDKPSLMSFREVETLFHEMGHGLQHMLTTIEHPDAAGINGVEWDAVELPSQFMENWCYHRPILMGMTAHWQTGEPLPEDLFRKIVAAKTYRSGSLLLRQLLFGVTDLTLHTTFDPDGAETAFDVQQRLSRDFSLLPMLPEDRSLCSFSHIFSGGYAAGYYSYKWAEILSADAFSAFEDAGLDNEAAVAETGRRFRDTVLSLGGSRPPMEVFADFRGREPTVDALLRHSGLVGGTTA